VKLRYGILCILILAVVLFLVSEIYEPWKEPTGVTPGIEAKEHATKIELPKIMEEKKESSNDLSYTTISDRNIFNPERRDFPAQSGPEGKKPLVRPQIILYGVTMAGDYQSASISSLGRPLKKGEREATTLKIGDRIGEYKLAKILPDRVALEAVEDTFEILLYDPNKPKQRVYAKAETKPASITTVLPGPPGSSTTSSASSQITPSQEAATPAESTKQTTIQPQVSRSTSATPYPYPTLRSRRAQNGS
jgi:hypothetical protein